MRQLSVVSLVVSSVLFHARTLLADQGRRRLSYFPIVDFGDEIIPINEDPNKVASDADSTPVAILHGMGDSCFNSGMKSIVTLVQNEFPSAYVKCVALGDTYEEDTVSYFALMMNEQVDKFAEEIMKDGNFSGGFRALGISQGNLIIRGYVQRYAWRYMHPAVTSFLSIHGPLLGVASLPSCDPSAEFSGFFCEMMDGITADLAYSKYMQTHLAQANYLRDPYYIPQYLTTDFLPILNFEKDNCDDTSAVMGMQQLEQLILVKAEQDTMVFPPESEWFGFYQDYSYEIIEKFNETVFYKDDLFGLKTLDLAGKVFFEATPGGHIEFTQAYLISLLHKYWE